MVVDKVFFICLTLSKVIFILTLPVILYFILFVNTQFHNFQFFLHGLYTSFLVLGGHWLRLPTLAWHENSLLQELSHNRP